MIIHKKGSLFDAPQGSYLAHSCNCQGIWGAGIAAEFAKRFPKSKEEYARYCRMFDDVIGTVFVSSEKVVCLMTSKGFGGERARTQDIIYQTILALRSFLGKLPETVTEVHSNKFNSGLFGVPWPDTETVLRGSIDCYRPGLKWHVWDGRG